jgi:hypothetical protein
MYELARELLRKLVTMSLVYWTSGSAIPTFKEHYLKRRQSGVSEDVVIRYQFQKKRDCAPPIE